MRRICPTAPTPTRSRSRTLGGPTMDAAQLEDARRRRSIELAREMAGVLLAEHRSTDGRRERLAERSERMEVIRYLRDWAAKLEPAQRDDKAVLF